MVTAQPVARILMDLPKPTDLIVSESLSPFYLLAVLCAARKAGDNALVRVTRRRLLALGVDIRFGDEVPPAPSQEHAKGGRS